MTKKELQQVRRLDSELKILRKKLTELEATVEASAKPSDGTPRSGKVGKPTEQMAIAITETVDKIKELAEQVALAKCKVWDFITGLDESLIRQIIILRFIDGKSWFKVADTIGGDATADGCRMYFNRANIFDD